MNVVVLDSVYPFVIESSNSWVEQEGSTLCWEKDMHAFLITLPLKLVYGINHFLCSSEHTTLNMDLSDNLLVAPVVSSQTTIQVSTGSEHEYQENVSEPTPYTHLLTEVDSIQSTPYILRSSSLLTSYPSAQTPLGNNRTRPDALYRTKRILIADESFINKPVLKRMHTKLRPSDFEFYEAEVGLDAVEIYTEKYNQLQLLTTSSNITNDDHSMVYDFILMDLMMPRMDGYECCKILRMKGCRTSIIITTPNAVDEKEVVENHGNMRIIGFISKPFNVIGLRKQMEYVASLNHYTDHQECEAVINILSTTTNF